MVKTVLWHGVCKWWVLAKQVTYTQYNFQLPFLNLGTLLSHLFICTNFCLYLRSLPHGSYTRAFWGHYRSYSPLTTKPNWEYPNWYSASTSSNFPCGKTWVRCIQQDGRSYPNPPRVKWHNTLKAETFHYQYQWMTSSIRSLHFNNCQEATSLCSWPHGILDSDFGSQQWIPQWLLVGVWLMFSTTSHFSVQLLVVRYGLHLKKHGFHWSNKNWPMRLLL